MVIALNKQKSSKTPKVYKTKETTLNKLIREEKEKKIITAQKEKEALQAIENEKKRLDKIITPYLERFMKPLDEKQLFSFWSFPDMENFIKINKITYDGIQAMVKKDVKKYKNRKVCQFRINSFEHRPESSMRASGIWLQVKLIVYHIDNNGELIGKHHPWGCDMIWKYDDFKFTKLTFKLLKRVMTIVAIDRAVEPTAFIGFSIKYVVNKMEQLGYDLSDVLEPLRGANIKEKK